MREKTIMMEKAAIEKADFNRLPRPLLPERPDWLAIYDLAWQLAGKSLRRSGKRIFLDIAWDPNRALEWVWDTCFVALFSRYGAGMFPGINGLDNFYDLQREDGYISMTYDLATGKEVFPDRINPPLFAWAEWEYYRTTGDDSRLARVIPHIERLMAWIDANRRTPPRYQRAIMDQPRVKDEKERPTYRLYYFEDCGSSGMDDSPRAPRAPAAGVFFDWIDLSAQMALSFQRLGMMHKHLGNAAQADGWTRRADELGALINRELWCDTTAFYHDRSLPTNFVGHKTAAGFWPMLAGICPPDRLKKLAAHLKNPKEFNTPTPVPTLSADDPNYSPQGRYWLGGVWAPTNYMIARGLALNGRGDAAHEIAVKYVDAMAGTWRTFKPATLWESYSPTEHKPGLTPYSNGYTRPDFVGWSALGPVAMLIENILGIDLDMDRKQLTWDIRLAEEHGLENLRLGAAGTINLHCARRPTPKDAAVAAITCDTAIKLKLRRGRIVKNIRTQPGVALRITV